MTENKRKKRVTIRLNEAEYHELERMSEGMEISTFIRMSMLKKKSKAVREMISAS